MEKSFFDREGVEKMLTYRRKINYYETDQMSIVHHSNYIRYFEEARLFWLEQVGLPYDKIEASGIIIPVTFVDCQYLKPLHYGEEVEIVVRLKKCNAIKFEISYEIYRENGDERELCTTGISGHCYLDQNMNPIAMKRKFPEIHNKMMELLSENR